MALFPLLGLAAGGVLLAGATQRLRSASSPRRNLVIELSAVQDDEANLPIQIPQSMKDSLVSLDNRYHLFLQRRISALTSGKRYAQWQEIAGHEELLKLTEEDKAVNHSIVRLSGIVLTGALAKLYTPWLLVTITLALSHLFIQGRWTYEDIRRERQLRMEHLFVLFNVGMWSLGYFVVGGGSLLIYDLIRKISAQSQDRTRQELVNIMGEEPRKVWVVVDNVEMEIPIEHLRVGDILVVQAGQMIPVDGVITQGTAAVDQQRLTGESQPIEKDVGDTVLAATVVLRGKIHLAVQKTGKATLAAQIGDVLANTLDYHLSLEERGVAIADRWVTPSLILTGSAALLRGLQGAVAVLSNMPGIDMMFLGPMTLLNFLNLASRDRILIKDGRSLELLSKIDTVIFDKTGTLTLEQPRVKSVHLCSGLGEYCDEETVLTYAAAAEQRQGHPIAKALLTAADESDLQLPPITDADYELGHGLRVWVECREEMVHLADNVAPSSHQHDSKSYIVRVGSERFMEMEEITIPTEIGALQGACHEMGNSLVLVALEDQLIGAIELQPTIRPEAYSVIQILQQRNLDTVIISGDQEAPTRTLARELGIKRYFANVLPEEKAAFVAELQAEGRTICFVGDGINDAIALKQAEVSISLRGATTIATDTAQVVLMDQTLEKLPALIDLANELDRNLMTSLALVTVPCCLVVGGVFFFNVGIPLAVTAYTATFVAGLLNAMSPMFRNRLTATTDENQSSNDQ